MTDEKAVAPAALFDALHAILGPRRAEALLGEDCCHLTAAMEAAAIRCFRERRPEDGHSEVLRRAFDLVARGKL